MSSQPVVMALEPVGLQRAAERRYTLSPNTTRNSPMGRAVLVTRPSLPASCQDRPHSQFHMFACVQGSCLSSGGKPALIGVVL